MRCNCHYWCYACEGKLYFLWSFVIGCYCKLITIFGLTSFFVSIMSSYLAFGQIFHWSYHLVFRDAALYILVIFESLLIIFWSQYYYDLISLFSWDLLSSLIFLLFISSALPFGVQGWCHWVDSLRSVRLIFCDPFGWSFVICCVDRLWSVRLIVCDPLGWSFVIKWVDRLRSIELIIGDQLGWSFVIHLVDPL